MELVGADGLTRVAEQSIVFALLVAIIAGLVWDRIRILRDMKEQQKAFMEVLKTHNEKYTNTHVKAAEVMGLVSERLQSLQRSIERMHESMERRN